MLRMNDGWLVLQVVGILMSPSWAFALDAPQLTGIVVDDAVRRLRVLACTWTTCHCTRPPTHSAARRTATRSPHSTIRCYAI